MKRGVLFLLAASLVPGAAGATVVQVGNNYEDTATIICASQQICNLSFTAVPAGERLTVSGLHCDFYAQNGVLLNARFGVSSGSGVARPQPMVVSYTSVAGTYRYYSGAIEATKRLIAAGMTPRVMAMGYKTGSANINIQINCQLIGVLNNVN